MPGGLRRSGSRIGYGYGYGYGHEKRPIAPRSLGAQGAAKLDEHGDDALEQLLAAFMGFVGDELASQTDIEHGGGLGRGADGDAVEAALVRLRKFACAFGDSVHDREGGAGELIDPIRSATLLTQLFDDDVGKVEEIESDLIDLKAFVIEGHASAVGPCEQEVASREIGRREGSGEDARPLPPPEKKVR